MTDLGAPRNAGEESSTKRISGLQGTPNERYRPGAEFSHLSLPTRDLAEQMIAAGLQAKLTCIDTTKLAASFAGHDFDETFLSSLPDGIDPCGERGEFHSFVYRGPMLDHPLSVSVGETVLPSGSVRLCGPGVMLDAHLIPATMQKTAQ
jgi:hypothetical protein